MYTEETRPKYLTELHTMKQYMDQLDIESEILEEDHAFPLHTLIINIGSDYKGRKRNVTLNFLPIPDHNFQHIHLLQFYTSLLFTYKQECKHDVEKLLLYINRLTAIGDFSLKGDLEIDFRYIYTASTKATLPQAEISETLILYALMLNIYSKWIEAVGTGKQTYDEVINEISNLLE